MSRIEQQQNENQTIRTLTSIKRLLIGLKENKRLLYLMAFVPVLMISNAIKLNISNCTGMSGACYLDRFNLNCQNISDKYSGEINYKKRSIQKISLSKVWPLTM